MSESERRNRTSSAAASHHHHRQSSTTPPPQVAKYQWVCVALAVVAGLLVGAALLATTIFLFTNTTNNKPTTTQPRTTTTIENKSTISLPSSTSSPPPTTLPPPSTTTATTSESLAYVVPYKLPPSTSTQIIEQLNKIPIWLEQPPNHRFSTSTTTTANNSNKISPTSELPPLLHLPQEEHYDTGQFRPFHAPLWDPHPQYKLNAFGSTWHLSLSSSGSNGGSLFLHRPIVIHHEGNSSRLDQTGLDTNCFYSGIVIGDATSKVSVSLCQGMTGHIRTKDGSFFIEPLTPQLPGAAPPQPQPQTPDHLSTVTPLVHKLYRVGPQLFHQQQQHQHHHHHFTTTNRSSSGGGGGGSNGNSSSSSSTPPAPGSRLLIHDDDFLHHQHSSDSGGEHEQDEQESGSSGEQLLLNRRSSGGPAKRTRGKRSMSRERYIELMVVTDSTMSAYHGENLQHYVLTLLSVVALIYSDASIGNPMNVALVKFHILKDVDFIWKQQQQQQQQGGNGGAPSPAGPHNSPSPSNTYNQYQSAEGQGFSTSGSTLHSNNQYGISASEMLRNFCKWQKEHNEVDEHSLLHHDTALLLTRETICRNPWLQKCDTLGLAELGTMCDNYASCAIVQDNGLSAAFTIAHELGHVMNMPHDDDVKCSSFGGPTSSSPAAGASSPAHRLSPGRSSLNAHYVMSRMLDHNTYPWAWSKCSRHYLTEFLDGGHGYCLEDRPPSNLLLQLTEPPSIRRQPGEIFSEDKQCQLVFGPNSHLCSYMPVCRRLWCTSGEEEDGCRTQHMPWADGTPCAPNGLKWCQRGACVLKDLEMLRMVDGGWGTWKQFGPCSRSCSGGVRRSTRECDQPLPSNGGKYCIGPRIRYESCNTHECSGEHKDFRGEQCSAFNNDNFNIQGLPRNVSWVPKYTGIVMKDRCKLFCRVGGSSAYYLLREKVIDGTPCAPDTFDICVNGACLPAGCDRRLHSKKVLDSCGICDGDSSTCQTTSGSYNETRYGYNSIVRIPAGASNLDVRQRGANDSARDDNYLAIMDPSTNEYPLNGHFVVSMFRKTIHVAGSTLEYSGSDTPVERINSTLPLRNDLIIQVLSVGKLWAPDVRYQYVISTSSELRPPHTPGGGGGPSTTSSTGGPPLISYKWTLADPKSVECSKLCQGTKSRDYNCVRRIRNSVAGQEQVEHSYCSGERPLNQEPPIICNTGCLVKWSCALPPVSSSRVHDCSPQSMSCVQVQLGGGGGGGRNSSQLVPAEHCAELRKECDDCEPTIWSECSRICGEGTQICRNCNSVQDQVRRCNNGPCGQWRITEWSPCSTTCGSHGIHRALYACHHMDGSLLPHDYCLNSPKPKTERKCENPPCSLQWIVGEWSPCSASCGLGRMERSVQCALENGIVNERYCDSLLKPLVEADCRHKDECPTPTNSAAGLVPTIITTNYNSRFSGPMRNYEIDNHIIPFDGISSVVDWIVEAWSECESETNFKVYRRRKVYCTSLATSECDGEKRPPAIEECEGSWWVSEWEGCNATCGEGIETRYVRCPQGQSCPASTKPPSQRPCTNNSKCKYRRGFIDGWNIGPWGKCSRLCGGGIKLRQVVCTTVRHCTDKPPELSSCNTDPCPIWHTNSWSECSADCGGGVQERSVLCKDTHGAIQPDAHCFSQFSIKPNSSRVCGLKACVPTEQQKGGGGGHESIIRWTVGAWNNCSRPCGKGIKRRLVQCTRIDHQSRSVQVLKDGECAKKKNKPREQRGCARFPCPFKWVSSEWSECSTTCGYGFQQRNVSCHRVNKYGWIDPDPVPTGCESLDKPKEYSYCMYSPDCSSPYRWTISDWSPCPSHSTAKCGRAYKQKRKVFCGLSSTREGGGGRVGGRFCLKNHKPVRRRTCPIKSCFPASCAEKKTEGEYSLWIGGTNITVYCSAGRGSSSSDNSIYDGKVMQEYISLPEENYSEIYAKRLMRPESCPRDGARDDSCECVEDGNRKVGFTRWEKIRLDVKRLIVDVDDMTFARQLTGSPISYGNAGDCYSSMNCPQGRFSINLQGTGLQVDPTTTWISQGHRAAMWINKSEDNGRVSGKCGGYCGNCGPNRLIGLKLQPV